MNNRIVKKLLLCLVLITSSLIVKAQTIHCYFPQEYSVDADSTLIVSVKVDSLSNVAGFSFSVEWDSSVLRYIGTDSLGITFSELSGFNTRDTASGNLGISWFSPSVVDVLALSDSTTMFSIVFKAIGQPGDTTALRFVDSPNQREFGNPEGSAISSIYTNGFVSLTGELSSTSFNSAPEKATLYPPAPNPFYEQTMIKFDLQQATQANILIMDQLGRVVFEDRQFLPAGTQTMPVSKEIFSQSGTYYWILQARDFRLTQKIMFINK